jgi:hypothetical protein
MQISCLKTKEPLFLISQIGEFLKEHVKVMEPVAVALEKMQGEEQSYLG